MSLDTSDYKVLKRIAQALEDQNQIMNAQTNILVEILQQMKYLR